MTKFAYTVYSAVTVTLLIASADLAAAPRRGMGAAMAGTMRPAMGVRPRVHGAEAMRRAGRPPMRRVGVGTLKLDF